MDMQLCGVQPDLSTFNSVLFSLSRIPQYRQAPSIVLQTLNEMKSLGIEPSLGSWKHVLTVFYPTENSDSNMLYKIMDYLEGKVAFFFFSVCECVCLCVCACVCVCVFLCVCFLVT